jgi:hypothetical protein
VTLRHVSQTLTALTNAKPISRTLRPAYPNYMGGMYLAKQPVAVTFPSATPSTLHVRVIGGALGDFGVFAIPYPLGTTFTVTRWGSMRSPAASADLIDGPCRAAPVFFVRSCARDADAVTL